MYQAFSPPPLKKGPGYEAIALMWIVEVTRTKRAVLRLNIKGYLWF
jgi:hypothetical protein